MDASFSRLVEVPENRTGVSRTWHVLDNLDRLTAAGLQPVGTMLCVHGNPTWSYLWRDLIAATTDAAETFTGSPWRVIAVDQLEMGFSERIGRLRPLALRVRDLADLTEELGLTGPVVTIGHDWGGVVSLGWAVDHPDLLSGVILLNTAIHQPEAYPIPAPLRLALGRSVLGVGTVSTPAFLETTLALARPSLPPEVKRGYRAPYLGADRRGGIGGFVADIPVDSGPDHRHESSAELDRIAAALRRVGVPTLMLWGSDDPIFSDRYLDDLVDRLPQAEVHRFEGASHLVSEDADYVPAVQSWIGALDSPDATRAGLIAGAESSGAESSGSVSVGAASSGRFWDHLDARRDSTDTALVEMAPPSGGPPRVVSWRLLSRRVRQLASGLSAIGVKPGDRVSLLIPPGADLTAVLYACLRIGAVVVVADAGLGLRGLSRAVRGAWPDYVIGAVPGLSAARALGWPGVKVSTTRLLPVVARGLGVRHSLAELIKIGSAEILPPAPSPDAVAAVLFTSGSTGPAKGVVYTHHRLESVRDALAIQYGLGLGTGLVAGFPPFALLGPALGARSSTPEMNVTSPKTLTATAVAAAVAAVDASVVFLSPAAIANVIATADALSATGSESLRAVRCVLSAGAPVSERLLSALTELMPNAVAHTPYGMTEGLLMTDIALDEIRDAHLTDSGAGGICVGRPTATTTIRISPLDSDGAASGELTDEADVTGEIVASGAHLLDRYDRLWMTDRAARRDSTTDRRWHRTSDVGHLDSAGRLWVEGRLSHVMVTADGVVTPVGLEQAIEAVPAVGRAAVVGVGPRGTQQLVAIVETRAATRRVGLAEVSLATEIRAAISAAGTRHLAAVLVVPYLPTDIRHNSKIDRTRLARWAERLLAGGRSSAP